ncbi:MAG: inorganic phosphate transporter [Paludibacteraceae bacterium]|nr:inorganic phosphate transporter [Paludibacteraceae bacterium]
MFLTIVVFMIILALFDLYVGVSNDAVNFLSSAIGAKVAKWRTIMIIAALGIISGAMMSDGMMDIARHGILDPDYFTFNEVMTVFVAVMITDVIVLDLFNTLKMPTSTTVSLVFELLGAAFIISMLKASEDASLNIAELLNFDKAFSVILAIFTSVGIAFFSAVVVQWVARMIFSFHYQGKAIATVLFGALAFTLITFFIFIKGIGAEFLQDGQSLDVIITLIFAGAAAVTAVLYVCHVNIFKMIVLLGTFALAMAFAGNDLVNFIGVPLAGVSSYIDFTANGSGNPDTFIMHSLSESAETPRIFLITAGAVMIVAIWFSRKAKDVVNTSVSLSSQDESDNMFGSSMPARGIVRSTQKLSEFVDKIMPQKVKSFINSRFNDKETTYDGNGAAFDMVRASVNLVLAAFLIIMGTTLTLPLSTTYVTFMVAMGSSLADKAWGRESAVFRVTGVLSVIGGWFITAGLTFIICSIICFIIYKCGFVAIIILMAACVTILVKNNLKKRNSASDSEKDMIYSAMMKSHDPEIIHELLNKHVAKTQSGVAEFTRKQMSVILKALCNNDSSKLRKSVKAIDRKKKELKKEQNKEILCMRRLPAESIIERNTWFYLGMNSAEQYIYCLKRMIEPIKEHIDNNFTPMPQQYADECRPMVKYAEELMDKGIEMIKSTDFAAYDTTREEAERYKKQLSAMRNTHTKRMQYDKDRENLRISLVYLNTLQEMQMIISTMRHQLRANKKFQED